MTKHSFVHLIGTSLLMCGFTFMSCSKDDDSEDGNKQMEEQANEIERQYTPPSDEIKPFVGFWDFSIGYNGGGSISYSDDGLYMLFSDKIFFFNSLGITASDWDYNQSTSTLSITYPFRYQGGIFEVTMCGEDSFIGTCMKKDGTKIPFSAKRRSTSSIRDHYLNKHYVSVDDESKEMYIVVNKTGIALFGNVFVGDTEYIKSNDLRYSAIFAEMGWKISYYTSTGKEISSGDTKCGDLDLIKIISDTIKHSEYKYVNSIEIHHPYSYNQSYLKLNMYAQYRKDKEVVKVEEFNGVFK